MDSNGRERIRFEEQLRNALDERQFTLHYQPQLTLARRAVSGVEALVRWEHPDRGILSPQGFLGDIEALNLMPRLTESVFRSAFAQALAWRRSGHELRICVNVSASCLYDNALLPNLLALCREYDVSPEWFGIEITEAVVLHDIARAIDILGRLGKLGFHLALDDFGTGYSSLSYLKRLPIHAIKIDKSFVLEMCRHEQDRIIVSSTVDLAHKLGFEVVAEGVETVETAQALEGLGCDHIQGHFLSRPLDPDSIAAWLEARRRWTM